MNRILLAFLLVICVTGVQAQTYTVTDLGPLSPTAINIRGQVVGNYKNQAYIWDNWRGMQSLGTLPGGTSSYAASINDLGVVTGTAVAPGTVISPYSNLPNQECSDLTQPFVWTPPKGMLALGSVAPPFSAAFYWCAYAFYGTDINDLGQVVGYDVGPDFYMFALLWTSAQGMTSFGDTWPPSAANGVNNMGQIVGQDATFELWEAGNGLATSWTNGVATDLGTLGGADVVNYSSAANGVNDLGQVVGWSTTTPVRCYPPNEETCPMHAVLWTRSETILDLGTLPGDTLSTALKINLFGQVIGSSGNSMSLSQHLATITVIGRPFVWSEHSEMADLNTLIRSGSGWVLNSVSDINFWGQIVGSGTFDGETHGFLLTPKL